MYPSHNIVTIKVSVPEKGLEVRSGERDSVTYRLLASSFAAIGNSSSATRWWAFICEMASSVTGRPSSFSASISHIHSCLHVLTLMRGEKRCFISLPIAGTEYQ